MEVRVIAGAACTLAVALLLLARLPVLCANEEFTRFEVDEARLRAVNTGDLQFLPDHAESALQTRSELHISAGSLEDGWVGLVQCQYGLDAVGVAEILYDYRGLRGLDITEQAGIDAARVEGKSVQLRGVQADAHICVRAQVRILRADGAGGLRIDSGPYHRRYLDGYFPLHLVLKVTYPAGLLRWEGVEPSPRPGLQVVAETGAVSIDTRFAGKLTLGLRFSDLRRAGGDY
jgi:hypothetical protein